VEEIEEGAHFTLFIMVPEILHKILVSEIVGGVHLLSQEELRVHRFLETTVHGLLRLPLLETRQPFANSRVRRCSSLSCSLLRRGVPFAMRLLQASLSH
jgi:hypothetical protein